MKLVPAKDHSKALIEWLFAQGESFYSEHVRKLRGERAIVDGSEQRLMTAERSDAWVAEWNQAQERGEW